MGIVAGFLVQNALKYLLQVRGEGSEGRVRVRLGSGGVCGSPPPPLSPRGYRRPPQPPPPHHRCHPRPRQFGEVSEYVGYIALKDHFPKMVLRPNPECVSSWCRKQQALFQQREVERRAAEALLPPPPPLAPEAPLHTSNDWGIEVDEEEEEEVEAEAAAAPQPAASRQQLANGIQYAHVTSDQLKETVKEEDKLGADDGTDLSLLMAQLSGLQK